MSERGTIVYIGNFELPDRNAAAHRVRGNARILRDLGYRTILLGVSRQPSNGLLTAADSGDDGIEAWEMAYPQGTREWMARIVASNQLDEIVKRATIDDLSMTISYNYPAIAQFRIARASRKLGARACADITEWYGRAEELSVAGIVKDIDTSLRMRMVNRYMDGLITTSPFISDYYADGRMPIVEIPTIFAASDVDNSAVHDGTDRDDTIRLFFAGTGFDPALVKQGRESLKDRLDWVIELLGRAAPTKRKFHLDVYGATRENYLAIVPEHTQLLQRLGEAVTFHGFQPNGEIIDQLKSADFSIFFRKATRVTLAGFPSKFAESVTHGTPVITNPMRSLDRYLHKGVNGFELEPSAGPVAAEELQEILNMPRQDIRAMKQNCRESGQFHHESYKDGMAAWLAQMGL